MAKWSNAHVCCVVHFTQGTGFRLFEKRSPIKTRFKTKKRSTVRNTSRQRFPTFKRTSTHQQCATMKPVWYGQLGLRESVNLVKEGKYTILMVDPDAPTAKAAKCRYWLHWAVTDVDGRHLRNGVNWMASEGRILKGSVWTRTNSGVGVKTIFAILVFSFLWKRKVEKWYLLFSFF